MAQITEVQAKQRSRAHELLDQLLDLSQGEKFFGFVRLHLQIESGSVKQFEAESKQTIR